MLVAIISSVAPTAIPGPLGRKSAETIRGVARPFSLVSQYDAPRGGASYCLPGRRGWNHHHGTRKAPNIFLLLNHGARPAYSTCSAARIHCLFTFAYLNIICFGDTAGRARRVSSHWAMVSPGCVQNGLGLRESQLAGRETSEDLQRSSLPFGNPPERGSRRGVHIHRFRYHLGHVSRARRPRGSHPANPTS